MSSAHMATQPSSWSSILKQPVMKKLVLYQIFGGLSTGIYGSLVMFFIEYLSGGTGGYLSYASYYLVSNVTISLLLLPGGGLSDRIGRRKVLRIGVFLLALSGFVAALATQVWHLLVASAVSAAGSAFISPAQASLVADISGGYARQKSYGIINFAYIGSMTFGSLVLTVYAASLESVPNQEIYYRLMLSILAVLGLASMIPIFLMREPSILAANHHSVDSGECPDSSSESLASNDRSQVTRRNEGRQTNRTQTPIRRNNVVLKIIAINALIGLGAGFIIPMMNYYFRDVFGLSQASVYAINTLGEIGIAVGCLFSPWLAKRAKTLGGRVGTIVTLQAASIVCAVYLAVSPWQLNLQFAVVAYIARQDLMNMLSPLTSSLLMDHSPANRRGVVNSLSSIAFNVPNAVSPFSTTIILGLVPSPYGYAYAISALVVLYTVATIIYSTTRKADRMLLLRQSQTKKSRISHFVPANP